MIVARPESAGMAVSPGGVGVGVGVAVRVGVGVAVRVGVGVAVRVGVGVTVRVGVGVTVRVGVGVTVRVGVGVTVRVGVGVTVRVGVGVTVRVGVGVTVRVGVGVTVRVGVGGAEAHPAKAMGATLVNATSVVARARRRWLPLVEEMALPERTVPRKIELVIVAAAAVRQYTLHACAVPPIFIWKEVVVRAPLDPRAPTLKTQTSVAFPLSVKMTPAPSVVDAAEQ